MYVVVCHLWVVAGREPEFIAASRVHSEAARREPGVVRFDLFQSHDDPSRFGFYELYDDRSGFQALIETAHFKLWRDTVAGWMARPRESTKAQLL